MITNDVTGQRCGAADVWQSQAASKHGLPDSVDRFLGAAALRPDAAAVVEADEVVTYGTLADHARALAALFAEHDRPSILVALPPGADAYAVMLAAGLAEGFYTPLNIQSPVAKWRHVCRVLQPDIIVGDREMLARLADEAPRARLIDIDDRSMQARLTGPGKRHEIAYVIFTSGSTGAPKGVAVPREGLDHYVGWIGREMAIRPDDRVSQYANIAFDLSVLEIYGALCFGASLHPACGLGDRLMPARMVERERLTIWVSVPSVVGLMIQAGQMNRDCLGTLRRFVFCGEPLLVHQVEAIFAACPETSVQNTYGPTEATVSMTSVVMNAGNYRLEAANSIAIGTPIEGMRLLLVGGPNDDEGELVIVGPQLARGYWQDAERTNRAFHEIIDDGASHRAYFTGDWAERRNGRIFFKERVDCQVKIKGYRIELDEIAAAVSGCGYHSACVFKHQDRLVAAVETANEQDFSAIALRRALGRVLDSYAVPEDIFPIRRLPRNDNDKIDRRMVIGWFSSGRKPPFDQVDEIADAADLVDVTVSERDAEMSLCRQDDVDHAHGVPARDVGRSGFARDGLGIFAEVAAKDLLQLRGDAVMLPVAHQCP